MPEPRPSGWIGSILEDRWRIDAKIARGGVATVFKASERGGPKVAVKIMHPEFARNMDARGRFLREGYVANKVGHPMVVKVVADGVTSDGGVFLVMELLEDGELLETKRERVGGRLAPEEVARIGDHVLDVLAAAHDQGIVHRDIKPENIFLMNDGTLKVLDFGIAHIREAAMKAEPTATGLLLGTPDFMSPEQAMGMRGTIDAQSDIYAIGATMFTLLTGEAVHTDQALAALVHSTSTKQARSIATTRARDSIPQSLMAVVDKALMLNKAQRWPTARAMQDALHKAMPMTFKPAFSQPPPEPQSKTRPLASIDQLTRTGANVRSTGKAPLVPATPRDGVKAVAAKAPRTPLESSPRSDRTAVLESPDSNDVATPREASSPWLAEFKDGDMEGETVALAGAPPRPLKPTALDALPRLSGVPEPSSRGGAPAPPVEPSSRGGAPVEPSSRGSSPLSLPGDADDNATRALPASILPPPPTPRMPPAQQTPSFPPPPQTPSFLPPPGQTPSYLPPPGQTPHSGIQSYAPHPAMPSGPPPPPPGYGSHAGGSPPAHGSNPYQIYNMPPPAPTPRGSGPVSVIPPPVQSNRGSMPPPAPSNRGTQSIPPPTASNRSLPPIPLAAPLAPPQPAPAPKRRKKRKRSTGILVAEIVLALLVVITLSIGVYLLLKQNN